MSTSTIATMPMIVARLTARCSMMRWMADWVRLGRWTTGCGEGGGKPRGGGGAAGGRGFGGRGGLRRGGLRWSDGGSGWRRDGLAGRGRSAVRDEHRVADLDLLAALE